MGGGVLQKRRVVDLEVSCIGLGTTKFGRNQAVKYPQAFDLPDDKQLQNLLAAAKDLGINLIDTAPAYGSCEERLGKMLQRHDWVICSKAGEEFIDGNSVYDFSSHAITKSVERSLQRLQTDYLDILLIHSDGRDTQIIEENDVFNTLEKLKQAGKIRHYGMSTKTVEGGIKTLQHAAIAMVTYHPQYTDEKAVIDYAKQNNKAIFIKKAFNSGHSRTENVLKHSLSLAGVTSVIVGTINLEHLRQNVASLGSP